MRAGAVALCWYAQINKGGSDAVMLPMTLLKMTAPSLYIPDQFDVSGRNKPNQHLK